MIKDRGTIKWTAMMLPEHVQLLKEAAIDVKRIEKPILDEQAIEELEMTILESIEHNTTLIIEVFNNGFTEHIKGTVHFINHIKGQLILKDMNDYAHHVPFKNIINIQPE